MTVLGMIRRWWLNYTHPPQTCFVYCACGWELCSGGRYLGEVVGLETYECAQCGRESKWLFDAPAPIRVTTWS